MMFMVGLSRKRALENKTLNRSSPLAFLFVFAIVNNFTFPQTGARQGRKLGLYQHLSSFPHR